MCSTVSACVSLTFIILPDISLSLEYKVIKSLLYKDIICLHFLNNLTTKHYSYDSYSIVQIINVFEFNESYTDLNGAFIVLINKCSLFIKYLYIYISSFELILKNVSVRIFSMRLFAMGSIPSAFSYSRKLWSCLRVVRLPSCCSETSLFLFSSGIPPRLVFSTRLVLLLLLRL